MNNKYILFRQLINELEIYEHRGVRVTVEGKRTEPVLAAMLCIFCEGGCYMRDYIVDEYDNIVEVGFNKVMLY